MTLPKYNCRKGKTDRNKDIVPIEMFESSEKRQEYIHQHLIDMLELITKIFREFRIPYFVHSGTLLGVVRENNIIPERKTTKYLFKNILSAKALRYKTPIFIFLINVSKNNS